LVKDLLDSAIQRSSGIEVTPERLLDHHASPLPIFLPRQARHTKLLNDLAEEVGSRRQIEEVIAMGSVIFIHTREQILKALERCRIGEFAGKIIDAPFEPFPHRGFHWTTSKCSGVLSQLLLKIAATQLLPRHSDDREIPWEEIRFRQVVERGD